MCIMLGSKKRNNATLEYVTSDPEGKSRGRRRRLSSKGASRATEDLISIHRNNCGKEKREIERGGGGGEEKCSDKEKKRSPSAMTMRVRRHS